MVVTFGLAGMLKHVQKEQGLNNITFSLRVALTESLHMSILWLWSEPTVRCDMPSSSQQREYMRYQGTSENSFICVSISSLFDVQFGGLTRRTDAARAPGRARDPRGHCASSWHALSDQAFRLRENGAS